MNALANSQMEELEKFLRHGYRRASEPVTFAPVHRPGDATSERDGSATTRRTSCSRTT